MRMKQIIAILMSLLLLASCGNQSKRIISSETIKTTIAGLELCSNQTNSSIEEAVENEFPDLFFYQDTQHNGIGCLIRLLPMFNKSVIYANLNWTYIQVALDNNSKVYNVSFIGSYESVESAKQQYDATVLTFTSKYGKGNTTNLSEKSSITFWTDDINSVGVSYEESSSLNGSDRSFCTLYYTNIALSNDFDKNNQPDI